MPVRSSNTRHTTIGPLGLPPSIWTGTREARLINDSSDEEHGFNAKSKTKKGKTTTTWSHQEHGKRTK